MAEKFVAVSGNIGVGKTTLVTYLTQRYGLQPAFEPFGDNPYLDDFYRDMKAWSFHSQAWFLGRKFRLHQDIVEREGTWVQDRTIYEDAEIFAEYLYRSRRMKKREYQTYRELYESMRHTLKPPDLLIHLGCPVRTIRKRIRQRGRASEQDIPSSYLRKLNGLYDQWIDSWDASPIIRWDTEKLDYLSDLVHRLEFHKAVEAHL